MITMRILILAVLMIAVIDRADARGELPPPLPFMGGNQGGWLGSGPIFGFEPGGGSMGGWGGGWWMGGGWGGWGHGSGGSGGYAPGGYHGPGGGNPTPPEPGDIWDGPDWESCFIETPMGGFYGCQCYYWYDRENLPAPGTIIWGWCQYSEGEQNWESPCDFEGTRCGIQK